MAKPNKALRKAAKNYKKIIKMSKQENKFETKLRKSVHSELKPYCTFAKDHSFIEVTDWTNEEGIDVYISDFGEERISMTWGQYKLLKKLVKELENS